MCGLERAAAHPDSAIAAAAAAVADRSGLGQQQHQAAGLLSHTGRRCFATDASSSGTKDLSSTSTAPGRNAAGGAGLGQSQEPSDASRRSGNLGSRGTSRPRRLSASFANKPVDEVDLGVDEEFAQLDALLREDKIEDAWGLLEKWYPDPEGALSPEEELQQALAYDPEEEERQARRERELREQAELAKRWVRVVDPVGKAYGTGKRKTSIARVWVMELPQQAEEEGQADAQAGEQLAAAAATGGPGAGALVPAVKKHRSARIIINRQPLDYYFKTMEQRAWVVSPLGVTGNIGKFHVHATVEGGGTTGQAQALRHGLARALQAFDPEMRPTLRDFGFLTRDPRIVERKKPGKAKARKSFQWVKR